MWLVKVWIVSWATRRLITSSRFTARPPGGRRQTGLGVVKADSQRDLRADEHAATQPALDHPCSGHKSLPTRRRSAGKCGSRSGPPDRRSREPGSRSVADAPQERWTDTCQDCLAGQPPEREDGRPCDAPLRAHSFRRPDRDRHPARGRTPAGGRADCSKVSGRRRDAADMTHKNDRVLSVKELARVEGEGALYLPASASRPSATTTPAPPARLTSWT